MKTIRNISALGKVRAPICLAAGFFDGVHRGHQEVLRRTVECAKRAGGQAWVLTFDTHPSKVLRPDSAPLMLTSIPHKVDLMRRLGIDGCLLIPFTPAFAAMPPETFLARLGRGAPSLTRVFVGADWRFGRGGGGDTAMLAAWGRAHDVAVVEVPPVHWRGRPISSTRIRDAIARGNLAEAAALLGRPFSILGTVIRGNRIGRTLGFPTANLDPHNEVRPPVGAYAVRAIVGQQSFAGIANFGHHPTVRKAPAPCLELHLLGTRQELYGRQIEVFFMAALRPERVFSSRAALARQIRLDAAEANRILSAARCENKWIGTLQTWYPDTIVKPQNKKR